MKSMQKRVYHPLHRAIAFITVLTFTAMNTASGSEAHSTRFARSGQAHLFSQPSHSREIAPKSLAAYLEVPESLGFIRERFIPPQGIATVIHIQDAHTSLEAQANIRSLLHYIKEAHSLDAIFVEGGIGQLHGENLRVFEEPSWNQEVAERLIQQGVLSGSEHFLLDEAEQAHRDAGFQTAKAYGVESAELYRKNLSAYRHVLRRKKESEKFSEFLKSTLLTAGSRILNPKLQKFFREWAIVQDRESEILRRLATLKKVAGQELKIDFEKPEMQIDWPHLVRFYKLEALERKIDINAATKDMEELKRWAQQKGTSDFPRLGGESHLSPFEATRRLLENFYHAAKPHGFAFTQYPALSKVWGQKILREEIDAAILSEETQRLTQRILDKLILTKKERSLVWRYQDAVLLSKLLKLELTGEEYGVLRKRKEEGGERKEDLFSLLPSSFPLPPSIFNHALQFYRDAKARDQVMFENMVSRMKSTQVSNAVMISGGFHSEGLKARMKEQGIGYVEIQPHMTGFSQTVDYEKAMLLQGLPKSKISTLAAGKILSISPPARTVFPRDDVAYAEGSLAAAMHNVARERQIKGEKTKSGGGGVSSSGTAQSRWTEQQALERLKEILRKTFYASFFSKGQSEKIMPTTAKHSVTDRNRSFNQRVGIGRNPK